MPEVVAAPEEVPEAAAVPRMIAVGEATPLLDPERAPVAVRLPAVVATPEEVPEIAPAGAPLTPFWYQSSCAAVMSATKLASNGFEPAVERPMAHE